MIRVAVCSLPAGTDRGQKTRHEFQEEVLNFGYHLGLDVLNSEVRLYLGLNDHGVRRIATSRKVVSSDGEHRLPQDRICEDRGRQKPSSVLFNILSVQPHSIPMRLAF